MFFFLKEFSICPQPFTQQFCSINVSCPRFQKVLQALSKLYYILNLCIAMIWFQLDVHFCQFGLQKIMSQVSLTIFLNMEEFWKISFLHLFQYWCNLHLEEILTSLQNYDVNSFRWNIWLFSLFFLLRWRIKGSYLFENSTSVFLCHTSRSGANWKKLEMI